MARKNETSERDTDRRSPRWREDFPITWGNDNYVSRRELAKFLTLGSGLLVLANAAVALVGKLKPVPRYPRTRLDGAAALPAGASDDVAALLEGD